ncbi:hypothetical protein DEDE109153_14900 [Deinococcus deserti]|uniref:Uncharacterized protein n=1 Tax=Deinococcus deserti (strain DSM 17065 / CIP 109153 / LMG 22923 / VCD115) TaxID=546414 RepID=C1D089_DEIDV|nr:hypothetical protein [Deinococcus deserti]ACO47358.2 hypothetical protein Deide_23240 [Deinococcus deserti VCD115]
MADSSPGDHISVPRHQQTCLSAVNVPGGLGYVLDSVPYGFPALAGVSAQILAQRHAAALGFRELRPGAQPDLRARQAAALAVALAELASGQQLTTAARQILQARHPVSGPEVTVRTDGSADKQTGALSLGYQLNDQPYALSLRGVTGHEELAEREAIRMALAHARVLGYTRFHVQSDHMFHVRRYDEALIHRGRRKSSSLERLDALVDDLGPQVTFEYVSSLNTGAPHRMALHALALDRLARGEPLSRA